MVSQKMYGFYWATLYSNIFCSNFSVFLFIIILIIVVLNVLVGLYRCSNNQIQTDSDTTVLAGTLNSCYSALRRRLKTHQSA